MRGAPPRKGKNKDPVLSGKVALLQSDPSLAPSSPAPSSGPSGSQEPSGTPSKNSRDLPVDSFFSAGDPNGKDRSQSKKSKSIISMCTLRDGTNDGPQFSVFDAVPK